MKINKIRLNEKQLRNIIKDTINRSINEEIEAKEDYKYNDEKIILDEINRLIFDSKELYNLFKNELSDYKKGKNKRPLLGDVLEQTIKVECWIKKIKGELSDLYDFHFNLKNN